MVLQQASKRGISVLTDISMTYTWMSGLCYQTTFQLLFAPSVMYTKPSLMTDMDILCQNIWHQFTDLFQVGNFRHV